MAILCVLLALYALAFLLRAVLSWFPIRPEGPAATLAGFLIMVTDPPLRPLRRMLRPLRVGNVALDFAPAIIVVVLFFVRSRIC
ncbi:MAG: YggT family protein [bacterium]|nr:YggT family protein [bacterium]MCY3924488.1 YggT family protein [bacterium]